MERTEYKRYSRDRGGQKQRKTRRHMQARTRRSASTIGGAAPEVVIGHPAAARAGARPYHCAIARYRQLPEYTPKAHCSSINNERFIRRNSS
jgi:hypothetical protein